MLKRYRCIWVWGNMGSVKGDKKFWGEVGVCV